MKFLLWLYFQNSQNDQIYVWLSITAPYGNVWLEQSIGGSRVLSQEGTKKKSVNVILLTQNLLP